MVDSIIYFPAQMKSLVKSNLILVSDYFHRGILQLSWFYDIYSPSILFLCLLQSNFAFCTTTVIEWATVTLWSLAVQ